MLIIDENVKSRAVVDLRDILHDAHNDVLHEKISMLGNFMTVLDPFYLLSNSVLVQTKYENLAFNYCSKQTCPEELWLYHHWRWITMFELVRPRVEDLFRVLWQRPKAS